MHSQRVGSSICRAGRVRGGSRFRSSFFSVLLFYFSLSLSLSLLLPLVGASCCDFNMEPSTENIHQPFNPDFGLFSLLSLLFLSLSLSLSLSFIFILSLSFFHRSFVGPLLLLLFLRVSAVAAGLFILPFKSATRWGRYLLFVGLSRNSTRTGFLLGFSFSSTRFCVSVFFFFWLVQSPFMDWKIKTIHVEEKKTARPKKSRLFIDIIESGNETRIKLITSFFLNR